MQPKKNGLGTRAGGWMGACAQTKAWERERQTEQQQAKPMEERVEKAVVEFLQNPEAVYPRRQRRPSSIWE
jgi:hypothetical protein